MTLTSVGFLPFLLAVLALSAVFGRRRRWLVLLVASYAFYATFGEPVLLAALAAVTVVSYACAVGMEARPAARRALLWLGIGVALSTLAVLKYGALLTEGVTALGSLAGVPSRHSPGHVLAAIGVSYYVLQAVSYLLDVHDEAVPAERHLGLFALYLSFFPKLIQGPIERAEKLIPQLRDPRRSGGRDLLAGTQLLLWGLFQKVVVADEIAPFVDAVYGDVHRHPGAPLVVATYLFAFQIYFDFSGYTDMAIGAARLFGIDLSPNFRSPYLARSVADFWRRWHISFSSWLLDYLFRPLQIVLRDFRTWGTPVALVATFLLSGLWHGASGPFLAWGLVHGLYLGTSVLLRPLRNRMAEATGLGDSRLLAPVEVAVTFHLVCFAWIFFRSSTLGDALWVVRHLPSGLAGSLVSLVRGENLERDLFLGQGGARFAFAGSMLLLGAALRPWFRDLGAGDPGARSGAAGSAWEWPWGRALVCAVLFYLVAVHGAATQGFIYEQF